MQVFLPSLDLSKSAQYLDDVRLRKQIVEISQILTANFNEKNIQNNHTIPPKLKIIIGHINHPITKHYNNIEGIYFLISYLKSLINEYYYRFYKHHQGYYTMLGFEQEMNNLSKYFKSISNFKPAYIKKENNLLINTTEDIDFSYQELLISKWQNETPIWTNRIFPDFI